MCIQTEKRERDMREINDQEVYVYIVRNMINDNEVARFDRIQDAFKWRMERDLISECWIDHAVVREVA